MKRRAVLEEDHERKVMYGDKVFRLTRRVIGDVVVLRAEVWDESGPYHHGWLSIHYWKGLKK